MLEKVRGGEGGHVGGGAAATTAGGGLPVGIPIVLEVLESPVEMVLVLLLLPFVIPLQRCHG